MKVKYKIFLLILFSSTIPIIVTGLYNIQNTLHIVENDALKELRSVADVEEKRIEDIMHLNFKRLDLISSRTQLRISLFDYMQNPTKLHDKIQTILIDAKNSNTDIDEILIYNVHGKQMFSTSQDAKSLSLFLPSVTDTNYGFDFFYDSDDRVHVYFSGPMKHNDDVIGIMRVIITPSVLTTPPDYFRETESGEFLIAKKQDAGIVLLNTPRFYGASVSFQNEQLPIHHALNGDEISFKDTIDYRGKPVLAVTKYFDNLGWGLVTKIDRSEILPQLQNIVFTLGVIIAATAVFSWIAAWVYAQKMYSSIEHLKEAIVLVEKGDFNVKITPRSNDEIGDLANMLNRMVSTLANAIYVKKAVEMYKENLTEQKLRTIGELGVRLAHDIRNPLSVIKNGFELVRIKCKSTDTDLVNEYERINRAVYRINHQINDVLHYIKSTDLTLGTHSIKSILDSAMDSLLIPKNIEVILPKNDEVIECDIEKIRAVLSNLMINSIQAIGDSTGSIAIRITGAPKYVQIDVVDSGNGITEEQLDLLFEPLYTTKQTGTGLGLSMCKKNVEQHGGEITVKINPTTFSIKLPRFVRYVDDMPLEP